MNNVISGRAMAEGLQSRTANPEVSLRCGSIPVVGGNLDSYERKLPADLSLRGGYTWVSRCDL